MWKEPLVMVVFGKLLVSEYPRETYRYCRYDLSKGYRRPAPRIHVDCWRCCGCPLVERKRYPLHSIF